jgi:hypothetical protein
MPSIAFFFNYLRVPSCYCVHEHGAIVHRHCHCFATVFATHLAPLTTA